MLKNASQRHQKLRTSRKKISVNIILLCLIFQIFAFTVNLSIPLGFDLYSHVIEAATARKIEYTISTDPLIKIPRYGLLTIILMSPITQYIGWWVIVAFTHAIAVLVISYNTLQNTSIKNITLVVTSIYCVIFYSATSLSLLFFSAYIASARRIWLLGMFLSPLGVALICLLAAKEIIASVLRFVHFRGSIPIKEIAVFVISVVSIILSLKAMGPQGGQIFEQVQKLFFAKIVEALIFLLLIVVRYAPAPISANGRGVAMIHIGSLSIPILLLVYFSESYTMFSFIFNGNSNMVLELALSGGKAAITFEQIFWIRLKDS